MDITNQKYPDYFPDNCPPKEASIEKKVLYRLCVGDNPKETDFISYYCSNPEKYKDVINAYGLSTLPDRDSCMSAFRKFPFVRSRYKTVAVGITDETKGSWLSTPSKTQPKHITWWVCEGIRPVDFFKFDFQLGDEL